MSEKFSEEAFRERVKQNYDFYQWAGHTKEGDRNVRISGFVLPSKANMFEVVEKEDLSPSNRQDRVTRYISVSPPGGNRRIITTVFECKTVAEAHETLIDIVMTYMAPSLPKCETTGLSVGDICFGSHGDVNLSVIFARFNILSEIKSATPGPTSVDEFARALDSLILNQYRTTQPG
jgi:hypothetical protein